jgi:alpha-1,2-mannosyltransferase
MLITKLLLFRLVWPPSCTLQMCLAAADCLHSLAYLGNIVLSFMVIKRRVPSMVRFGTTALLVLAAVLGASRSAALVANYSAPMRLPLALPAGRGPATVCSGAEWHRHPSAFFLPGPQYSQRFIESGFKGLLPRPFDRLQGGAAAAPAELNDANRDEPANYIPSGSIDSECDYLVTLREKDGTLLDGPIDAEKWREVVAAPFVDNARSPWPWRAFYVPWVSWRENYIMDYVLLETTR